MSAETHALSSIDAILTQILPLKSDPDLRAPSNTKASDRISLETSKPVEDLWKNRCSMCNGLGSKRHSSTQCCLVCRNYSHIDDIAEAWKVKIILELSFKGRTLRDLLQAEDDRYNYLRKEEKKHYQRQKSCKDSAESLLQPRDNALVSVQAAIGEYNEIVSSNPHRTPQSDAAMSDYEMKKKMFDEAEIALQNAKNSFEEALKDHGAKKTALNEQINSCTIIVSNIAQRLVRIAQIDKGDTVGRARLFFSWVSKSITYDANARDDFDAEERTPIRTILSTSETCHGFAGLFDAMFNSGRSIERNECSIYIPGHLKEGQSRSPTDANGHAWNAFPLGDGTWKLIDTTLASSAKGSAEFVRQGWFTRRNEDFALTHIPETDTCQFRNDGQHSVDKDLFWKADFVSYTSQCTRYRISESSIRPANRLISVSPVSRTVFKFKKSCAHFDDQQCSFVLWSGKAPKGMGPRSIDVENIILLPLMLDHSGWRVSIRLPKTSSSAILFALLSDGHPAFVKSIDEWKLLETRRSYVMIARWVVRHLPE